MRSAAEPEAPFKGALDADRAARWAGFINGGADSAIGRPLARLATLAVDRTPLRTAKSAFLGHQIHSPRTLPKPFSTLRSPRSRIGSTFQNDAYKDDQDRGCESCYQVRGTAGLK